MLCVWKMLCLVIKGPVTHFPVYWAKNKIHKEDPETNPLHTELPSEMTDQCNTETAAVSLSTTGKTAWVFVWVWLHRYTS